MKTLADAFEHTLKDVYYAENAILKALPKVIEAVSQGDFKGALRDHLAETKEQIKILAKVFKTIDVLPSGEKCDAIEGLIKETEGIITEAKGPIAKNAALAGACQAIAEELNELADIWPAARTVFVGFDGPLPDAGLLDWQVPSNAMVEIPAAALAQPQTQELMQGLQQRKSVQRPRNWSRQWMQSRQ